MKTLAKLATIALVAVGIAGVAVAGKPSVIINGGGIAMNDNHGTALPSLRSVGGFTAKVKNGTAKGSIQSKSISADDPSVTWGSIHGSVVCVMNIGPAHNAGFSGDVWEVRFLVTKGKGIGLPLVGFYGSLFVFDGGSPGAGNDGIDEGFADLTSKACGGLDAAQHNLEAVIAGNFTVH